MEGKRKFQNPTPQYVGAVIYNEDNKRKGVAVAPGEFIWLDEREERATAEAPRQAKDNPFVAEWQENVGHSPDGTPITQAREGMLILVDPEPRPIPSSRHMPSQVAPQPVEETIGAPPPPQAPPPEGKPAPNEVVGTPGAVEANDKALAAREKEKEKPTPIKDRPQGSDSIGLPPREPAAA